MVLVQTEETAVLAYQADLGNVRRSMEGKAREIIHLESARGGDEVSLEEVQAAQQNEINVLRQTCETLSSKMKEFEEASAMAEGT